MDGMEYQLIEAVFEAKHSLHRVIHFAKVPRGTFAALFLIDQMNREPQQINDLEEQGYVVKLTAKQDRRFVYLMLTQEGQAVLCQAKHAFFTAVHEIVQMLGQEDSRELLRLLRRIAQLQPQSGDTQPAPEEMGAVE